MEEAMRKLRGCFRLPGSTRNVPGEVVTGPSTDGITLELDDCLSQTAEPADFQRRSVIHGRMLDGTPVTLLDCQQIHTTLPLGGGNALPESYLCGFWILGATVRRDELYSSATFSLTDLVPWMNWRGFDLSIKTEGEAPVFCIETREPVATEAKTERGLIRFRTRTEKVADLERASFRGSASIEVFPDAPLPLRSFLELYARPFQDLVTLATGRPQDIVRLTALTAPRLDNGAAEAQGDLVDVRFARWSRSEPIVESPLKSEMLFMFEDLRPSVETKLDSWFELDREVPEARTLATGTAYRPGMFLDQKFLYAAHATETYHRQRIGGEEMEHLAHRARMEKILASVPEIYKGWLKSKLAFSNELTFRARLLDLRGRGCHRVEAVLSEIDHWEDWIRDTRNFNTHFTKKKKVRVAEGEKLLALTASLLLLLDDLMMSELGFSEGFRSSSFDGTPRYVNARYWSSLCDWSPR